MADEVVNTFNNVNGMNPIIFSKKVALAYAKLSNKVKDLLTNNYWEGEIKQSGDKVRIVVPNPEAINISDGEVCPVPQGLAPEAMDLVVDKMKSFALAITDKEKAQTQFKNFIDGMATAVAQKIGRIRNIELTNAAFAYTQGAAITQLQYGQDGTAGTAVTKYTPANHPLAGEFGTQAAPMDLTPDIAYQFMLQVKMALLDSGSIADDGTYTVKPLDEEAKDERAVFICGPKLAAILLAAYQLSGRSTGDGDMVVKDGLVTRVAGLDVHIDRTIETAAITASANATQYPFLAGTKNAFTEASQISKVENIRDPYCFQDITRGLELYGFKLVHPEALVRGVIKPGAAKKLDVVQATVPVTVVNADEFPAPADNTGS